MKISTMPNAAIIIVDIIATSRPKNTGNITTFANMKMSAVMDENTSQTIFNINN